MATVPNHSQSDRIARDVAKLMRGEGDTLQAWIGNSYRSIPTTHSVNGESIVHSIRLIHWDTTIAEVVQGVGLTYFDARYHSGTTRSFQSRILKGLANLQGEAWTRVQTAYSELARPTGERSVLDYSEDGE